MNWIVLWTPVLAIVLSDVVYQVCAKKLSSNKEPLAALGSTYLESFFICVALYEIMNPNGHFFEELTHFNWMALVVGFAITGLEVGSIYMYKVGWAMNVGFIVYTAGIVVLLLFAGSLLYGEAITVLKVAGVALAMVGMGFIVR